jgi:hypothetical protein
MFLPHIIGYYMILLAITAITFLKNFLLLLATIVQGPKTLIIAINRILLLQLIFLATNYMHYRD